MIIALVNQKGGVGKSTLAVSMASELRARGKDVLLIDADSHNRTAMRAATMAGNLSSKEIASRFLSNASSRSLMRQHEHIIIDAAGHGDKDLTAPLMVADLALIPCAPTTADAGVIESMREAIKPALHINKALRVALVLTKLLRNTRNAQEARSIYRDCGIDVFRSVTYTRVAWQRCLDTGIGVAQYAPKSVAAEELRSVLKEALKPHPS